MSGDVDERRQYLMNVINAHLATFDRFQSSKEQIAYGATTVVLVAAAGLVAIQTPFWLRFSPLTFSLFLLTLLASFCLAILFVWWQLRGRRNAFNVYNACFSLSAKWVKQLPTETELDCVEVEAVFWPSVLDEEYRRIGNTQARAATAFFDYLAYLDMFLWCAAALLRVLLTWWSGP